MKKTKFMATIIQQTGWCVRRVYEDVMCFQYVRINGEWYCVDQMKAQGIRVEIWQD